MADTRPMMFRMQKLAQSFAEAQTEYMRWMNEDLLQSSFHFDSWNRDQVCSGIVLLFLPLGSWVVLSALDRHRSDPISKEASWWIRMSFVGIFVQNLSVIWGFLSLVPLGLLLLKIGNVMVLTAVHYEIACAWDSSFDHFMCRAATITHIVLALTIFAVDMRSGTFHEDGGVDKGLSLTSSIGLPFLLHMLYHIFFKQHLIEYGRLMLFMVAPCFFIAVRHLPDPGELSATFNHTQTASLIGPGAIIICFVAVKATLWLRLDIDQLSRIEREEELCAHVERDNQRILASMSLEL